MSYSAKRSINNTFFADGTPVDGIDGNGKFIECKNISNINGLIAEGVCVGVRIGATEGVATLGTLKYKMRGDNSVSEDQFTLGEIHPIELEKIYKSGNVDARDVTLYYK